MTKGSRDEHIKAEILKAAQKLFQQFGLNKTTMEEIAQAAGKGKSTLYYYYKSKEEIFDAVLFYEMDDVFRLTQEAIAKAPTASEKLREFAITKFKVVQDKTNLYNIVSGEIREDIKVLNKVRNRYNQCELNLLINILEFGIQTKEFEYLNNEALHRTAFTMISSFRGLKMSLFFENRCYEVEAYMDHLISIMLHYIRKNNIINGENNKIISDFYQVN